jgi:hypothetical protein
MTDTTDTLRAVDLPRSCSALLPCPFCGGEAYLLTGMGGSQFGKCKACGAEGSRVWRRAWTGEEDFERVKDERRIAATEKWNMRPNAELSDSRPL